jgi:ethanolamine ammonia-lyase small subunit
VNESLAQPDPWSPLRKLTAARVAIGRAGGSLPTAEVLSFAMDHAEARDAVDIQVDFDALEAALKPGGLPIVRVATEAADRATYLLRPDYGRRLDATSLTKLTSSRREASDVAILVGDGLSAPAAQLHAPVVVAELVKLLRESRLAVAPLVLVRHARVAVEDQIGELLRARVAVILLGERPGLGSADSLGAYLVFDPKPAKTDADRNCVSNIRPAGLQPGEAARTLHYLIVESMRRQISGVQLKDERARDALT